MGQVARDVMEGVWLVLEERMTREQREGQDGGYKVYLASAWTREFNGVAEVGNYALRRLQMKNFLRLWYRGGEWAPQLQYGHRARRNGGIGVRRNAYKRDHWFRDAILARPTFGHRKAAGE